jgi:methionyl aminopeptidase
VPIVVVSPGWLAGWLARCRYMGHGVNTMFHCAPTVPHYKGNKAVGVMKEGHAFTIEPMLNLGGWRDEKWPDGWTAVTADGARSAQFEHTLLVTEEGVEILTARLPTSRADVVTNYKGQIV